MDLKDLGLQKLRLNINDDIIENIIGKEGDHKSRGLDIQILQDNVVVDTTGITVEFYAMPKDGKLYLRTATAIDVKQGRYEILYPTNILQPGLVDVEIRLVKGEQVITSKKFYLDVEGAVASDDIVNNSDERPLLAILVEAAKNEKSRIETEQKRVAAENRRVETENKREQNESQRKSTESQRQKNEEERKTNEAQRQSNESSRQSQESKRNEAENKRAANEESRKGSEATRRIDENRRVAAENERVKSESTRKSNENTRVANETKREQNRKIVEGWIKNPSQFNGKNLEFHWNGTKLGVRLKGDEEYQYVDLKGAKGDAGSVENLTEGEVSDALGYIPADEVDLNKLGGQVGQIEQELDDPKNVEITTYDNVISLPGNAIDGQLGLKLKGDTRTNLLENSSFNQSLDKWEKSNNKYIDIVEKDNMNVGHITGRFNAKSYLTQCVELDVNKTYTFSCMVKTENIVKGETNPNLMLYTEGIEKDNKWFGYGSAPFPINEGFDLISHTFKTDEKMRDYPLRLCVYARDFTGDIYFYNAKLEEGDMATKWHEGTKSTPASQRIKSVGKNLFDGELEYGAWSFDTGKKGGGSAYRSANFMPVEGNAQYTAKSTRGNVGDVQYIMEYDKNKSYLGHLTVLSNFNFKTKSNTRYITFRTQTFDIAGYKKPSTEDLVIQIEKGNIATGYESYKEDMAYVTAKEDNKIVNLNRLPNNTVDKIDLGRGELVKNTKDYTLQSSDIKLVSTEKDNIDYAPIHLQGYARGNLIADGVIIHDIPHGDIAVHNMDDEKYIGTWGGLSSRNGDIAYVVKKGATLEQAKEQLVGTKLIYQLAEPYEIPVRWEGVNGYKDGTIYIENIFPEIGFYYNNGLYPHYPDYPIGSVDTLYKVDKETGLRTSLDVSKCKYIRGAVEPGVTTILGFRHPDLENGDLCDWDYIPADIFPNPETTITADTNLSASIASLLNNTKIQKKSIRELGSRIENLENILKNTSTI